MTSYAEGFGKTVYQVTNVLAHSPALEAFYPVQQAVPDRESVTKPQLEKRLVAFNPVTFEVHIGIVLNSRLKTMAAMRPLQVKAGLPKVKGTDTVVVKVLVIGYNCTEGIVF